MFKALIFINVNIFKMKTNSVIYFILGFWYYFYILAFSVDETNAATMLSV